PPGPNSRSASGPFRDVAEDVHLVFAEVDLVAIGSGLRAMKELKPLTPEAFDLDGDPPKVTAEAAYTKNKREAVQPIPDSLVDRLRPWLVQKALGKPVFKGMTHHTAEMLRHDLEAAKVPYETSEGVVDFHALRSAYITYLVHSGASVKTCQTLARHSSPTLTIGIYAKTSLHDVAGAVESLPDLTAAPSGKESHAATGTDGRLAPRLLSGPTASAAPDPENSRATGLTHKQPLAPSLLQAGASSV